MYLSRWLERVLAPGKMGGAEDDEQEGELMSEVEDSQEDGQEEVTRHWAVRAAASIALLFKVMSLLTVRERDKDNLIPGRVHRLRDPVRGGAHLPRHHDLLGPGIRSALDPRILLLHLDLSRTPALHGDQEGQASQDDLVGRRHLPSHRPHHGHPHQLHPPPGLSHGQGGGQPRQDRPHAQSDSSNSNFLRGNYKTIKSSFVKKNYSYGQLLI